MSTATDHSTSSASRRPEAALQAALAEQEQLLRALEAQQARLETTISNVPGLVWETWWEPEREAPRPSFVSDYVEPMLGYTPEEWNATPDAWLLAVHPEDRARIVQDLGTLAGGSLQANDLADEIRFLHRDGRVVWTSVKMRVIRDSQGKAIGLCGVTLDVTARKEAERTLQEREARYRTIVETVQEGIWIVDAGATTTFANQKMAEMLGCRVEDIIGRTPFSFMDEADRPLAAETLARVREGRSEQTDFRFRRRDGSDLWTIVSCSPHFDAGGTLVGGLATVVDTTARRQTEEALRHGQKMEAVGVLAGGVAHDFNNLLTVINGFADLLRTQLDDGDPRADYLEEIRKAGERAASLTGHLLAFSRRQILQPKVVDLNEVVRDMGALLRRLIGEDIELRMSTAADLAPVHADPGQLGQVLLNFAANARDAMPTGGLLTIETENFEIERAARGFPESLAPGRYVRLAVSDTGRGMDAATRARVFEPFFTTKEPGKGTGLGLSTVYGIVKQSGGDVTVYSEPGRGTTLKVYLPCYQGAEPRELPEEASPEPPGGSETVLLVEDEPGVASLVRNVLSTAGYRVLSATDPVVARAIAEEAPEAIDLLLTDVVMPGMGGRELAEELGPRRPEMRVLYMSGYTPDVAVRHGVSEATVGFVQKPVSPTALLWRVREALDAPARCRFPTVREWPGDGRDRALRGDQAVR